MKIIRCTICGKRKRLSLKHNPEHQCRAMNAPMHTHGNHAARYVLADTATKYGIKRTVNLYTRNGLNNWVYQGKV